MDSEIIGRILIKHFKISLHRIVLQRFLESKRLRHGRILGGIIVVEIIYADFTIGACDAPPHFLRVAVPLYLPTGRDRQREVGAGIRLPFNRHPFGRTDINAGRSRWRLCKIHFALGTFFNFADCRGCLLRIIVCYRRHPKNTAATCKYHRNHQNTQNDWKRFFHSYTSDRIHSA